jgi:hypothetical protein
LAIGAMGKPSIFFLMGFGPWGGRTTPVTHEGGSAILDRPRSHPSFLFLLNFIILINF